MNILDYATLKLLNTRCGGAVMFKSFSDLTLLSSIDLISFELFHSIRLNVWVEQK